MPQSTFDTLKDAGLAGGIQYALYGNPYAAIGTTALSLVNSLLGDDEPPPTPSRLQQLLVKDQYVRWCFGYRRWPLFVKFANRYLLDSGDIPTEWGNLKEYDRTTTVRGVTRSNYLANILDNISYISHGQMSGLKGVFLDKHYIPMRSVSGTNYPATAPLYVPTASNQHGLRDYRDQLHVRTAFELAEYPYSSNENVALNAIYTDRNPIYSESFHDADASYVRLSLVEHGANRPDADEHPFWRGLEFPQTMGVLCSGVAVYDLSKWTADGAHLTADKVYTDNAVAVIYYVLREKYGLTDERIDMRELLDSYNYAEKVIDNNNAIQTYRADKTTPIAGSDYPYFFDNFPRYSRRYSFTGAVELKDTNIEREFKRFEAAINGQIVPIRGKLAVIAGRIRAPRSVVFTDKDFATGGPTRISQQSVADRFNALRIRYQSQVRGYEWHEIIVKDEQAIERDGQEIIKPGVVVFEDIADELSAKRAGVKMLLLARNQERIECPVNYIPEVELGDVVTFSSTALKANRRYLEVAEYQKNPRTNTTNLVLTPRTAVSDLLVTGELAPVPTISPAEALPSEVGDIVVEVLYCRYRIANLPTTAYPSNSWMYLAGGTSDSVQWTTELPEYTETEPYRFFTSRYILGGVPYQGATFSTPTALDFRGEVAFPVEVGFTYNLLQAAPTFAERNLPQYRWRSPQPGGWHFNDIRQDYLRAVHGVTQGHLLIPANEILSAVESYVGVPPYDKIRLYLDKLDGNNRTLGEYFLDIFKRTVLNKPDDQALAQLKGFGYQRNNVIWLGARDTLIQLKWNDSYWVLYQVTSFSQAFHTANIAYSPTDEAGYLRKMRALTADDLTHFGFRLRRIAYKFENRPTTLTRNTPVHVNVFGSRNLSAGVASAAAGQDGAGKEFRFTLSATPTITDATKLLPNTEPYDTQRIVRNGQVWTDEAQTPTNTLPFVLIVSRDVPGTPMRGDVPDLMRGWSRWGLPTIFAELGRDGLWLEYAYFQHSKTQPPVRPTRSNIYVGTSLATAAQRNRTGFLPLTRQSASVAGDQDRYGQWLDEQPSVSMEKPFTSLISRMRLPGHTQSYTEWSTVKALPSSLANTQVFYLALPRNKYRFRRTLTGSEVVSFLPLPPDTSATDASTRNLLGSELRLYIRGRTFTPGVWRVPILNFRAVQWVLNDFPDEFNDQQDVNIYRCQRTRQADGSWGAISRVVQMGATADVIPEGWEDGQFLTQNAAGESLYEFPYPDTGDLDSTKRYVLTVNPGSSKPAWADATTFATIGAQKPNTPRNFRTTATSTNFISLAWDAPTGGGTPTHYIVTWGARGSGGIETGSSGRITGLTTTIRNLSNNTNYLFQVQAWRSSLPSDRTATVNARTQAVQIVRTPPGTPSFTISDITTSGFTVRPTKGTGPTPDFIVLNIDTRSPARDGQGIRNREFGNVVVTGLQPGRTYYVKAYARIGTSLDSGYTADQSVRTTAAPTKSAPVLTVNSITSHTFAVSWTDGVGLTGDSYIYSSSRNRPDQLFGPTRVTAPGRTYTYRAVEVETQPGDYRTIQVARDDENGARFRSNVEKVVFTAGSRSRDEVEISTPPVPKATIQRLRNRETELALQQESEDVDSRQVIIRRMD